MYTANFYKLKKKDAIDESKIARKLIYDVLFFVTSMKGSPFVSKKRRKRLHS